MINRNQKQSEGLVAGVIPQMITVINGTTIIYDRQNPLHLSYLPEEISLEEAERRRLNGLLQPLSSDDIYNDSPFSAMRESELSPFPTPPDESELRETTQGSASGLLSYARAYPGLTVFSAPVGTSPSPGVDAADAEVARINKGSSSTL